MSNPNPHPPSDFLCPECGGTNPTAHRNLSPTLPRPGEVVSPWAAVLVAYTCAICRAAVPSHLAERHGTRCRPR